jgi:hypothetical protein
MAANGARAAQNPKRSEPIKIAGFFNIEAGPRLKAQAWARMSMLLNGDPGPAWGSLFLKIAPGSISA